MEIFSSKNVIWEYKNFMEKEIDIVALGELLIDFTEAGRSSSGKKLFEQNPGGAQRIFWLWQHIWDTGQSL